MSNEAWVRVQAPGTDQPKGGCMSTEQILEYAAPVPVVAALFVQPDGCYAKDSLIDLWPESRDARTYSGPLPVIAHPPCHRWGSMAAANFSRWGGEHNRPGNDGGCFKAALDAVNMWGGVLEHPAATRAWKAYGLTKPNTRGWQRCGDGWVCEVWQSAYGHRANKATWLYYRGTREPHELRWSRIVGSHQIGFQDQRGKARNKPTLSKREANATPIEFRDELIRLAQSASSPVVGAGVRSKVVSQLIEENNEALARIRAAKIR